MARLALFLAVLQAPGPAPPATPAPAVRESVPATTPAADSPTLRESVPATTSPTTTSPAVIEAPPSSPPETPIDVAPIPPPPAATAAPPPEPPPPPPAASGPPTRPSPPPLYRPELKAQQRAKRDMFAGFGGFVVVYAFTAIFGGAIHDTADRFDPADPARARALGLRLTIPIAGPFAAIPKIENDRTKVGAALVGVVQAGLLVLGVIGLTEYLSVRRKRVRIDPGLALAPHGGLLSLSGRF